ncbi:MAG: D-alanyl-D-alanine carboxypeptidase [Firmicutes bacterium]|nr:D-alanyl-D-alanine carboxypeptidase [Bacillota bacterium]
MLRKIAVILTIMILICSIAVPAPAAQPAAQLPAQPAAEPVTTAVAALVMDAENGQVLYSKEADQKMYPASTTKIMTALVALENSSLDEMVAVSPTAAAVDGSRVGLQPGEKLPMEDLLYMLMLTSANDSAEAIAEHISGSAQQFAQLMNRRAAEIGARNTHFTNPHGLQDPAHYTTARDLALIGREAMKNATFRRIVGTVNIKLDRKKYMSPALLQSVAQLEQIHGPLQQDFYTHNKLLTGGYYGYQGAIGIKTGYTVDAGQCIVAMARRNGREMIAVVLNSQGAALWSDAAALLDYGFQGFSPAEVIAPRQMITDVPVKDGAAKAVLETNDYFYYDFPAGATPAVSRRVELDKNIKAPLEAGKQLGELVLEVQGREVGRVPLVTVNAVSRSVTTYLWLRVAGGAVVALLLLWWLCAARRRQRRSGRAKDKRGYYLK